MTLPATDGQMAVLLETRALCKSFVHEAQTIHVLKDVNLTIRAGERIAVVGSSGAGKSTLLHVLGALDLPTSGSILFEGKDLVTLKARQLAEFRNRSVGFMFQFHHLLPEFSALENVMMPALIQRAPRADATEQAQAWLDAVGLSHRTRHRPGELSGGEQQRVALARALMTRPKILLADEPTGNLDSRTGDEIHAIFERINEEYGTALLLVTHNASLARRMPRVVEICDGQLIEHAVDSDSQQEIS